MKFTNFVSFLLPLFLCICKVIGQVQPANTLIQLMTDKQVYQPGEKVWLNFHLWNNNATGPDSTLATIHVELLSKEDQVINKILLFGVTGKANGYITLPANLGEEKYSIRAFFRNAMTREIERLGYKEIEVTGKASPLPQNTMTENLGMNIEPDSMTVGLLAFKLQNYEAKAGCFSVSITDEVPSTSFGFKKQADSDSLMLLRNAEKGIPISGTVYNLKNMPVADAGIRIITSNGTVLIGKTDSIGRFYTSQLYHVDSVNVIVLAKRAKKELLNIEIDPFPAFREPAAIDGSQKAIANVGNQKGADTRLRTTGRMLNEVVIKSRKDRFDKVRSKLYDKEFGVTTIDMKDIPPGYQNVAEVLKGRIPNISRGSDAPVLYLVDGMFADQEYVDMLSPFNIAFIDVLRGPEVAVFGSRGGGGVIAIYTKTGELSEDNEPIDGGSIQLRYPGFQKPMDFKRSDLPAVAGIPKTWYWNPSVKIDENDVTKLSFPKPEKPGTYWIKAEGFSDDGKYCYAVHKFEVE